MTMITKFINNHEKGVLRALEIFPGLISWNLILFPYWGIFVIQAAMKYDWVADLKSFPDYKKVHNFIIIVTYKEPLHTLQRTLQSIANQSLPREQITVVLATEAKEDE